MKTRQIKAGAVYTGQDGELRHVLDVYVYRSDYFVRYCVWKDDQGIVTGISVTVSLLDFANWAVR